MSRQHQQNERVRRFPDPVRITRPGPPTVKKADIPPARFKHVGEIHRVLPNDEMRAQYDLARETLERRAARDRHLAERHARSRIAPGASASAVARALGYRVLHAVDVVVDVTLGAMHRGLTAMPHGRAVSRAARRIAYTRIGGFVTVGVVTLVALVVMMVPIRGLQAKKRSVEATATTADRPVPAKAGDMAADRPATVS